MPRRQIFPMDDYVIDVLMRDLVGHDHQPAAFLVYLYLFRLAQKQAWKPVSASVRMAADATGISKSTAQLALAKLRMRQLIVSTRQYATDTPQHRVLRPWRQRRS